MSARKRSKAPHPTTGDAATTIEALNGELAAARAAREAEQAAAEEQLRAIQERLHAADQRVQEVERRLLHQHRQQGHVGLTGLAAVEGVFHFLPTPAGVLRAATACRRWRELAGADSVWRARFEREGLVEKARVFEIALPAAVQDGAAVGGGGSSGSSSAAAESEDELAGVGLAFYAQVFALKVRVASLARHLAELAGAGAGSSRVRLTSAHTRRARLLCRGTR